jgi:hypothetical protein
VGAALAAGPVALAVVCAMPHTVTATAQPTTTAPAALRNPDPAGVATLFCDLWLRSDATNADSTTAQAVAVSSARLSDGSWSVVVAAQFTVRNDISGASSAADADSSPTPGPARALVPAAKVRGDPQPTGPHTPSNDAITEGQFA